MRWHGLALTCCWKLCFNHPGQVLAIRGNPDLHFEGAGNGPVVITWMGSTAANLRSRTLNIVSLSDMIEGSYRF